MFIYFIYMLTFLNCRWLKKVNKQNKRLEDYDPKKTRPYETPEEIAAKLNLELTPAQRTKVEAIKKAYKGGKYGTPEYKRSVYRDVPLPEEVQGTGNFFPKIAPDAEKLIDYALTFVPDRAGYRGSRKKKRMLHRQNQRVKSHKILKANKVKNFYLKQEKLKKLKEQINVYKLQAAAINEKKKMAEVGATATQVASGTAE